VEAVINSLGEHMRVTQNAHLDFATQLLAMARLELQLSLYDIEQSELDIFCAALEHPVREENPPAPARFIGDAETTGETDKLPAPRRSLVSHAPRASRRRRG
jgi:hypothetical protein